MWRQILGFFSYLKMNEIIERGQNLVVGPNNPGQRSAWIHSEKHFLSPSFGIHTRQPPVSNVIDHCGFAVCLVNNCAVQLWDAVRDTEWRMLLLLGQEATRVWSVKTAAVSVNRAAEVGEPFITWALSLLGEREGRIPRGSKRVSKSCRQIL